MSRDRYVPDYLKNYSDLRTDDGASLLNLDACVRSYLVIDGGSIVCWHDTAILTDQVDTEIDWLMVHPSDSAASPVHSQTPLGPD